MKAKLKTVSAWFKRGIVPFFVIFIPIYLSYYLWIFISGWGLHLVDNPYIDVFITIILIIVSSCFCGFLVSRPNFENFAKEYLVTLPVIGWLVVIFVLPKRNLNLVEVKTTWGPSEEESNWEYALETCEPWEEDGVIWHRTHTLGWTGKLFSRIGDKNVRKIKKPAHKIWLTIFSLGLLE